MYQKMNQIFGGRYSIFVVYRRNVIEIIVLYYEFKRSIKNNMKQNVTT